MFELYKHMWIALLFGLLLAACAPAVEGAAEGVASEVTEEALDTFSLFDADQDEQIDRVEYLAEVDRYETDVTFDDIDANDDEFVTRDEFEPYEGEFRD